MQVLLTLLVQENSCREVDTLLYEQITCFQSQYYISSHLSASCTGKWMSVFNIAWFQNYIHTPFSEGFLVYNHAPLWGLMKGLFLISNGTETDHNIPFFWSLPNWKMTVKFFFGFVWIDVIFGSSFETIFSPGLVIVLIRMKNQLKIWYKRLISSAFLVFIKDWRRWGIS